MQMNFLRATIAGLAATALFFNGALAQNDVNINFADMFVGFVNDKACPTCPPPPTPPAPLVCAKEQTVLFGSGSSSVGYILPALINEFNKVHPNISVAYTEPGSGQGVIAAGEGIAHFGMLSRAMSAAEKTTYPKAGELVFAVAPVVLAINTDSLPSGVTPSLTKAQIVNIFKGTSLKWSDVDASYPATAIQIVGRESSASVRSVFEGYAGKLTYPANTIQMVDSDPQMNVVTTTVGAITYTTLSNVNTWKTANPSLANKLILAVVDGGAPTVESIKAGSYPILRNYEFLTTDAAAAWSPVFSKFMYFVNHHTAADKIITDNAWVHKEVPTM